MTITPDNAKALAISYAAFCTACDQRDYNGKQAWGDALLAAQETCDVTLIDPRTIRGVIFQARCEEETIVKGMN